MREASASTQPNVDAFIARWTAREGGAERANYGMFLTELCGLIDVRHPDPAGADTERNDYVFERAVRFQNDDSSTSVGRIDLCVPKIRFGNNGDEGRQGQAVR